ncbi:MAG: nucleotide exchange factor GrpE [Clostridiaceae bacterium]|nr:nucleotide exchange factor GrpE [Clostridiaceae bacterium]
MRKNMSKQKRRQTEQTEPIEQNQTPDGGETLDQAEQPVQETPEQEEPAERPDPLAESQAQYQQLNDKYLRTLAEYDNYRKRSQKEREGVFGDAQAMTAGLLLPVLDNLDLALQQPCADEEYKKGVELIAKQFREILEKMGVTEIPAQGQPFDPRYHDAVMHVEQEELPENTVSQVLRKGYQLGDRVIRCAMVQVAN